MKLERPNLDVDLADECGRNRQYWTYVDPFTGRYCVTNVELASLVLFPDEEEGRKTEPSSKRLRELIGHYVKEDEARDLAAEHAEGRAVLCVNGEWLPIMLR
jgi:hypothetical protein